jgi:hypothetical protein
MEGFAMFLVLSLHMTLPSISCTPAMLSHAAFSSTCPAPLLMPLQARVNPQTGSPVNATYVTTATAGLLAFFLDIQVGGPGNGCTAAMLISFESPIVRMKSTTHHRHVILSPCNPASHQPSGRIPCCSSCFVPQPAPSWVL